jgi:DNA-binding MltR family transcriptional regulator
MNIRDVEEPLNQNERYLHGIVIRQNILIEQMSTLLEHIAKKDNIAVEKEVVKEAPKSRTRKKKEVVTDEPNSVDNA